MSTGDTVLRQIQSLARATAASPLEPVGPHLVGYGAVAQAKWAAWRRKEHLESACEENLEDQIALVASDLDPVFNHGLG